MPLHTCYDLDVKKNLRVIPANENILISYEFHFSLSGITSLLTLAEAPALGGQ